MSALVSLALVLAMLRSARASTTHHRSACAGLNLASAAFVTVFFVAGLRTVRASSAWQPYEFQNFLFPKRLPSDSFPCTPEEKICFSFDRVWHQPDNKCYRVGTPGPCPHGQEFVVVKHTFEETGRFVGECRSMHLCDSETRVRMMDGRCYDVYPSALAGWSACPNTTGLLLYTNVFGEGSCCDPLDCLRPPPIVTQPDVKGRCYAPSLEYKPPGEVYPNVRNPLLNIQIPCDEEQQRCFEQESLWFAGDGRCYQPLEPCGGGAGWVVADKASFSATAALAPKCASARCPPGRVFLAAEQACRSLWDLQNVACAGDDILLDVFGEAHCARGWTQFALLRMPRPLPGAEGVCMVEDLGGRIGGPGGFGGALGGGVGGVATSVAKPKCAESNSGLCQESAIVEEQEI